MDFNETVVVNKQLLIGLLNSSVKMAKMLKGESAFWNESTTLDVWAENNRVLLERIWNGELDHSTPQSATDSSNARSLLDAEYGLT